MKRSFCCPAFRAITNITLILLWIAPVSAQAQISVGIPGSLTETFSTLPLATSWSTLSLPGTAVVPEDVASMDAFINGPTNAASAINGTVGNSALNPPGASAVAQWSSTGFYLQTQPTGNAVTLLMATLRNDTGSGIHFFTMDYEYQQRVGVVAAEAIPGHRVYYSVSGAAGRLGGAG